MKKQISYLLTGLCLLYVNQVFADPMAGTVLPAQVEEEANVGGVLAQLKMIGDDKHALYALDKELAARTFVQPVIG